MRIELKTRASKIAATVVIVAIFLALVISSGRAYLAYMVSRTISMSNLELASKLDPDNSEYHWRLGRMYQYGLTTADPERAVAEIEQAIRLSPFNAQAWLDLGAAEEFQGRVADAEACLQRADYLAPNLPGFQWAIGNFFLLHGNVTEAFRHFRVVLAGDDRYDSVIFSTAWKASGEGDKILAQLIPPKIGTELNYLDFLLSTRRNAEAAAVWARIASSGEAFPAGRLAGYIDSLIGARQAARAYDVWNTLRRKGLIPATEEETPQNLVINGDFEENPLNMGFDWRVAPVNGVYVGIDRTTFHSGGHSLRIEFPGNQNLDYHNVYEYVRVVPGRSYRLHAFLKAEGITTDSGPRLEVRDAYDRRRLDTYSEMLLGTTEGWSSLGVAFTAPAGTDLVAVGIARVPSEKIDSQIAGKVWVDDVTLAPAIRGLTEAVE
jgi:hypothetical protein